MTSLEDLLDSYAAAATLFERTFESLAPEVTTARPAEGWTPAEVAVHMADAELVRATRIRVILGEHDPVLFTFDEERWQQQLAYSAQRPQLALDLYRATVTANRDLLLAIGPAALDRHGLHPTDGALTIRGLVERGIHHAHEHAEQLRAE